MNDYDNYFSKRYENLCKLCNLDFKRFFADSVNVEKHNKVTKKYINEKILNESNYYKNIILNLSEFDNMIKLI